MWYNEGQPPPSADGTPFVSEGGSGSGHHAPFLGRGWLRRAGGCYCTIIIILSQKATFNNPDSCLFNHILGIVKYQIKQYDKFIRIISAFKHYYLLFN